MSKQQRIADFKTWTSFEEPPNCESIVTIELPLNDPKEIPPWVSKCVNLQELRFLSVLDNIRGINVYTANTEKIKILILTVTDKYPEPWVKKHLEECRNIETLILNHYTSDIPRDLIPPSTKYILLKNCCGKITLPDGVKKLELFLIPMPFDFPMSLEQLCIRHFRGEPSVEHLKNLTDYDGPITRLPSTIINVTTDKIIPGYIPDTVHCLKLLLHHLETKIQRLPKNVKELIIDGYILDFEDEEFPESIEKLSITLTSINTLPKFPSNLKSLSIKTFTSISEFPPMTFPSDLKSLYISTKNANAKQEPTLPGRLKLPKSLEELSLLIDDDDYLPKKLPSFCVLHKF